MGGGLSSMSWSNYIDTIAQKEEKIEIEVVVGFEFNVDGERKVCEHYSDIPNEDGSQNRYWGRKIDFENVMGKQIVNSRYNIYKLNPEVFEDVKAFVVRELETL